MRSVRITVGLAAVMCVFAITAAPSLASVFKASVSGNTKGVSVGKQEFFFGGRLHIVCEAAKAKGTVAAGESPTFTTVLKFTKCVRELGGASQPEPLKARFLGEIELTYHANGYVVMTSTIELKVSGTKCLLEASEETIPVKAERDPNGQYSAAVFSIAEAPAKNLKKFPSGFQQKLVIANEFKGLEWEASEGDCELWTKGTEGENGRYSGTIEEEVGGGSLSFEA